MIVIDTHILVWMLQSDPSLGAKAQEIVTTAIGDGGLGVSAISVWEIAMLAEKDRLKLGRPIRQWIDTALAIPNLQLLHITPAIAVDAGTLPGSIHGDPADRLIVATARQSQEPLLTADHAILAYAAAGHVEAIDARR